MKMSLLNLLVARFQNLLAVSCIMWVGMISGAFALPLEKEAELQELIDLRAGQIELLRASQDDLQERIQSAESELEWIDAQGVNKDFESMNVAVGLRYDIRQWRDQLKRQQIEINALQRANRLDINIIRVAASMAGLDNTPETLADITQSATGPTPVAMEELEKKRRQQQQLIQDSRGLPAGKALVMRARAKALEPLLQKPLLGEQAVLLSMSSQGGRTIVGIMQHIGGNQYYLEALLKPGKQVLVIGGYEFPETIPADHAGIPCIILLDLQTLKPSLQYFTKQSAGY